jgi:hypothetical protein
MPAARAWPVSTYAHPFSDTALSVVGRESRADLRYTGEQRENSMLTFEGAQQLGAANIVDKLVVRRPGSGKEFQRRAGLC